MKIVSKISIKTKLDAPITRSVAFWSRGYSHQNFGNQEASYIIEGEWPISASAEQNGKEKPAFNAEDFFSRGFKAISKTFRHYRRVFFIMCLTLFGFALVRAAMADTVGVTILPSGLFSPSTVTIIEGDRISWVNTSEFVEEPASDTHIIPFADGHNIYPELNVGPLSPGGSVTSPPLYRAGTWGYHNHSCGGSCPATIVIRGRGGGGGGCADCVPPGVKNFSVAPISATSADVVWTTDEPSLTRLEYGTSTLYGLVEQGATSTFVTDHQAMLRDLIPGTHYFFRIWTKDILANSDYTRYPNQMFMTPNLSMTVSPAAMVTPATSTLGISTAGSATSSPEESVGTEMDIVRFRNLSHARIDLYQSGFRFIRPLRRGASGEEVKSLQIVLALDPGAYPEGFLTGYFGPLTEAAVKRFQAKHGIVSSGNPESTGFGLVGPKTRAKLNEILAR